MGGTQSALIAALAATTQAVFAQHGDFAPKVQVIIDYLKTPAMDASALLSPVSGHSRRVGRARTLFHSLSQHESRSVIVMGASLTRALRN